MLSTRRINKLRALGYSDWRLLLESAVLLSLVKAGLCLLPFKMLARILKIDLEAESAAINEGSAYEQKVVWAIEAVCRRVPVFGNCLNRALATQIMLRKRGREAKLQLGVIRDAQGKFEAHAWLERDGRIIIGTLPDLPSYTPLSSYQRR